MKKILLISYQDKLCSETDLFDIDEETIAQSKVVFKNVILNFLNTSKPSYTWSYDEIKLDSNAIEKYIVGKMGIEHPDLSFCLYEILSYLNYISDTYLSIFGYTYQLEDVFSISEFLDEKRLELQSLNFDNVFEVNDIVSEMSKDIVEELHAVGCVDSLTRLIKTKTRGSNSSIINSFFSVGYKIDNDSSIIIKFITDNLFEGITEPIDFYNAGIGSRNALLQSVSSVKDSGYLARKVNFLTKEVNLTEDFCGSDKFLEVNVTEENYSSFVHRYYYGDDAEITLVDRNVIGKTIKLFSPITCKSEGHTVCKVCYGDNYKTVDKFRNIGLFSSTILMEKVMQSLLSSKHKQFVNFQELPEEFLNHFEFDFSTGGFINKAATNLELNVNEDGILFLGTTPVNLPFKHFTIVEDSKIGEIGLKVSVTELSNSDMNFLLSMMNQIFEKTNSYAAVNDYTEYYDHIIRFIKYSGFQIHSLHPEIILMMMCRNTEDPTLLFKERQEEPYTIFGAKTSILECGNIFDSISFERVKETLSKFKNYNTTNSFKSTVEEIFNGTK